MIARKRTGLLGRLAETSERTKASPVRRVATTTKARESGDGPSDVVTIADDSQPVTHVLRKSRIQSRPARIGEYLHVSDLIGKCIRRKAIIAAENRPSVPQAISVTDTITFAQGDAIHEAVRSRTIFGGGEYVWGNWSCKCGTTKTTEPCTHEELGDANVCKACGGGLDVYVEVPMRNEEHKIVGNPDLVFYLPDVQAFYVNELKSISHAEWEKLARPLPDHVIQVVFYWYLMRALGYRMANRVSVVYISKGWKFGGDIWKEFSIDATKEVSRLAPYLAAAKAYAAARKGGDLPKRECITETDTKARACDTCRSCFSVQRGAPVPIDISGLGISSRDRPVSDVNRVRLPPPRKARNRAD